MTTYVALLYSIILPKGRLVMTDLKDLAEKLGLENPRTFLATGNLVFEAKKTTAAKLEQQLETAFDTRFGNHIDIIIRTAAQWRETLAVNPFSDAGDDTVAVRIQRDRLDDSILDVLKPYCPDSETIRIANGDLWIRYGDKPSDSRLNSALTKKRLGIGTSRVWNTLKRLEPLLEPPQTSFVKRT
ncbi:hypothetical protein ABAC460_18195 [Asticcacaulis sp. AC460]|uniref:DUF1697 domain-containing protein n=1 Tax=Asticcacaulis sp. AC460 TaxID=1282360 RepID=UPI0003C3B662|nr:DUF1697 domain-containing protein [Asticcacaulis sp. AC460]ESQ87798.1 hypothetical protein ABAC460_18195 [Asticcacaulis sp. AC460]